MTTLLHGTSTHRAEGIEKEGLKPQTGFFGRIPAVYLTDSEFFAEDYAKDRGFCDRQKKIPCEPVVCEVDVPKPELLMPDWASYDSPLKFQFKIANEQGADCLIGDYECLRDFYDYELERRGVRRYRHEDWGGFIEVIHSVKYPEHISPNRIRCRVVPWTKLGWNKPPYSEDK